MVLYCVFWVLFTWMVQRICFLASVLWNCSPSESCIAVTNQSKPPVCSTNHEQGKTQFRLSSRVFSRAWHWLQIFASVLSPLSFRTIMQMFIVKINLITFTTAKQIFLKLRINVCLVLAKVVSTFVLFFYRDSYQHWLLLSFINRQHDRRV